jgi:hypothetical protein
VAGVADAAAKQDGSEESFREYAAGEVTGKFWSAERVAVHFADFGKACEVDLFADERRQGEDLVQVTGPADKVLIANQFVQTVGAQASHAAEKIDGCAGGGGIRVRKQVGSIGRGVRVTGRRGWRWEWCRTIRNLL